MMRFESRVALFALLAGPLGAVACAQILSYDDYSARPEVKDTAPADVSTEVGDAADAPEGPARPPLRPAGAAAPSGKGKTIWLGVKHMYVGSLTSLGAESADAWKEWGYDIDHVCTSLEDSKTNINTCRRPTDANQDFLLDGLRCRDNNFGRHVIALIKLSSSGFETRLNSGLFDGGDTWLLRIDDVDDGPDDAYAPAKFYHAASLKSGAKWDGTDLRQVLSDSVTSKDLNKPLAPFDKGYIKDNIWVSGEPEQRRLLLPVSESVIVPLTLDSTVMTVELTADHKNGTRAMLAGAVPIKSIDSLLLPIAASAGICPGSGLYTSLWNSMQRFPDVVIGAPNLQDTTVTCDGISLGIGMDMSAVLPATTVVDPPAADAGVCDTGPG